MYSAADPDGGGALQAHEIAAARMLEMMAKSNAARRPVWKGAAMSEGKKLRPVSVTCCVWAAQPTHAARGAP